MKKTFCKLPPLQWLSFLSALIAALLQIPAWLLDFEAGSNYFVPGALLPKLALLFALLSFILGLVASCTAKKQDLTADYPTNLRKLHLFPAIGLSCALIGLAIKLLERALEIWGHHTDGTRFLMEFLNIGTIAGVFAPLLLIFAVSYCLNWAFSKKCSQTGILLQGFCAMIGCALMVVHIYFDFSVEMNAPVKMILQGGGLSAMILFTTELRLPLRKPLPRLLLILSNLLISAASLGVIAIPVAFLTGKLAPSRIDHLLYALFLLFMVPVALEHILTIFPRDPDPDTERTDTL